MDPMLNTFWPTFAEIDNCIKAEAESAHESLILAVHEPTTLAIRNAGEGDKTETAVSEQDLLNAFMTPNLPTGTLLLPITGESGVGKSHMIRWLYAQLKRTEEYRKDKLHIIRIPKSASLKKVVQLILDPLKGEQYDQLRSALQKAAAEVTPEVAGIQLQYGLKLALKQYQLKLHQEIRDVAGPDRNALQLAYGHADKLPLLLSDSALCGHYESVLAGIIMRAIEGKKEDDDKIPQFTTDDLLLPDQSLLTQSGRIVITYYSKILNDEAERLFAINILNKVLDDAIGYAFNLGQNLGGKTLQDIFLDIREYLFRENKELVLLIEDFAALAGIQDSLLKICIQEAVRDGEQVICRMRTAVAVTDGDWSGRDTVFTRVQNEWRVKSRLASVEDVYEKTTTLVGSYLNAARHGDENLRKLFSKVQENNTTDIFSWLSPYHPEKMQDETFEVLEAFGKTSRNHYIFPFNTPAIKELVKKHLKEGGELNYNPRKVINGVLRNVLLKRDSYERGEFPVANFDGLPLSMYGSGLLTKMPDPVRERYSSFLRIWGGNPQNERDLLTISPLVVKAFYLEPLPGMGQQQPVQTQPVQTQPVQTQPVQTQPLQTQPVQTQPVQTQPVQTQPVQTQPVQTQPVQTLNPKIERWRNILEEWANSIPIPQADANILRNLISDGLKNYINWNAWLLAPPSARISEEIYFNIHLAKGSNSTSNYEVVVADNNNDLDGRLRKFFLALVRYDVNGNWNYPDGEEDCIYYAESMENLSGPVIKRYREIADARISVVGNLLAVSNLVLGGAPHVSKDDPGPLLDAIWQRSNGQSAKALHRDWEELVNVCTTNQNSLLVQMNSLCTCFQGEGSTPYAVDVPRMLSLFSAQSLYTDITNDAVNALYKGHPDLSKIRDLAQKLRLSSMKGRMGSVVTKIQGCAELIGSMFDQSDEMKNVSKSLLNLINDAQADGFSWPSGTFDVNELKTIVGRLESCDVTSLRVALDSVIGCFDENKLHTAIYNLNSIDRDMFIFLEDSVNKLNRFISAMETNIKNLLSLSLQDDAAPVIGNIKQLFETIEEQFMVVQEVVNDAS